MHVSTSSYQLLKLLERLQARQGRLPIWARLRCGRYKRDYYHNNLTGQDVWQKPNEFTEPHPMDVLRGLQLAPDVRGAVCMQRTWRQPLNSELFQKCSIVPN